MDLTKELKILQKEKKYSLAHMARALNISSATLHLWMNNNYTGNVQKINDAVASFLQIEKLRNSRIKLDFIKTSIVEDVFEVAKTCHVENEIGVCCGNAGLGKTFAVKKYAIDNPDVIFIMPVQWAFKEKFKSYIKKGYHFYWIPFNTPASCLGVAGYCFNFAIHNNFRKIYFTGFDATGLANEILHTTSHFYGKNEENDKKTTSDYKRDFYMFSRHLSDLIKLARSVNESSRKIINITDGGLLDMFPREDFNKILQTKQ